MAIAEVQIWDDDAERCSQIAFWLEQSLRRRGLKLIIVCHSEAPMLARHGFLGKTPAIQFGNDVWRKNGGLIEPDIEQLIRIIERRR